MKVLTLDMMSKKSSLIAMGLFVRHHMKIDEPISDKKQAIKQVK